MMEKDHSKRTDHNNRPGRVAAGWRSMNAWRRRVACGFAGGHSWAGLSLAGGILVRMQLGRRVRSRESSRAWIAGCRTGRGEHN